MNITDKKIDMLLTIVETADKKFYIARIDEGKLHVAISVGSILNSIRQEFETICYDENNWVGIAKGEKSGV